MKHTSTSPADTLAALQARRAKQLRKREKARAALEKTSQKLGALEESIAVLVHQEHAARTQLPEQHIPRRGAALLFNPRSKGVCDGTYSLEQIVSCLNDYGFDVTIGLKTSGKAARAFVRAAVRQKQDLVIVAAGDGSIEDIIGTLVGTHTALGILPIGTMNNLARALGVPLQAKASSHLVSCARDGP